MIPMVPMKSSTGIPRSTWMFLKASSASCNFSGDAAWPSANGRLLSHTTAMPATDVNFMFFPS